MSILKDITEKVMSLFRKSKRLGQSVAAAALVRKR